MTKTNTLAGQPQWAEKLGTKQACPQHTARPDIFGPPRFGESKTNGIPGISEGNIRRCDF
jgi:hypothetical protein